MTSSSFVHAHRLIPRESVKEDRYDPYIICEGPGPTHREGLPRAYSEDQYRLNLYLCSTAHGVPRHNVGCGCTRARGNVRCSEDLADPDLWRASYKSMDQMEVDDAIDRGFRDGVMPFWEYCWSNCLCIDAETAQDSVSNNSIALSVLHRYRVGELARQRAGLMHYNPAGGGAVVTSGGTGGTGGSNPNRGQSSGGAVVHTQCGNNCTSNDDCEAPASPAGVGGIAEKGSNCTCRAQSSQYQPGPGTVAFVAACLINMATGGKREESLPCPCNSTYVSHGCCGAKNGWISEAPAYKLGELLH